MDIVTVIPNKKRTYILNNNFSRAYILNNTFDLKISQLVRKLIGMTLLFYFALFAA
jgi:hypothetical protein